MPKYTFTILFIAAVFLFGSSAYADTSIRFVEKRAIAFAPARTVDYTRENVVTDPGLPNHDELMQADWDNWQAQIVNELAARVKMMARLLPPSAEPLEDKVSFSVSSDGSLSNVHLERGSKNKEFNMICVVAVNSLKGNALLKYPKGSSSAPAQKSISFTLLPPICTERTGIGN